ncbi:MAG: VCBS repeat-containing protein [Verrucomicrobia bacterium]|nr:VCBS repeat-containing protein [Verrucomicrobiota bacterium]
MPHFDFSRIAGLATLLLALPLAKTFAAEPPVDRFGFAGPEIFPIDPQVGQLHVVDLDGDGLKDIVVINNQRSKINLLHNRTGKTNQADTTKVPRKRELNELPPDSRFRIDSVASEKRIASLAVADLNSDGRPDLAYYGEPKELVVQLNLGTNGWSQPKRWPIEDGQLTQNALIAGDVNGDGRTDLLLVGETQLYLLAQNAAGSLDEPVKIPFSGNIKATQSVDINGDGLQDLLMVNWDNANPFRFRLQGPAGQHGPEIHFALPPIRSYWSDDLDGDKKTEVISIALNSGRAQISDFASKPAEPLSGAFRQGQFQVLPLNRTDKDRRGILWADLNNDNLPDLLVAEPASGQLTVFLQKPDGSLAPPKTFPTFSGVSELAVADWNGDGKPELFLLSPEERQIGATRLEAGNRLPFPTLVPTEGKPLVMAVGRLAANARPVLAVISDQEGRRSLRLHTADGKVVVHKMGENFKANPVAMTIHDVNQDGRPDLIVLIPYEKIKVLVQTADGAFTEADVNPPGGNMEQPWMSFADVDGDGKAELLLAQKNFLRAVVLTAGAAAGDSTNKPAWTFTVKEQINGASATSRIIAAAPLVNGTNRVPSLFLLDADRKALTLSERDAAGVWQAVKNLPLPVTEFTSLAAINLGAGKPNTVAFIGLNGVAWQPFHGQTWELKELDSYETPIKDGRLMDVVSGDLNQDGRKDLVFLETAKNHLDIVSFTAAQKLVPANRWQVFEERTFRSRRGDAPEPREAVIADVTGDGKNDLVIIVHDRVLVYPQE